MKNLHLAINVLVLILILIGGIFLQDLASSIHETQLVVQKMNLQIGVISDRQETMMKSVERHHTLPSRKAHPPE